MTESASIKAAMPGSIHAAAEMAATAAADKAETALAALLGSYRENRVGDFVASASSIKAFKQKRFYESGGDGTNIYMLLGHVAHTAFDWAMQVYNKTGQLPPYAELQAKAHQIWDKESIEQTVHLMSKARESALGYRDSMDARMQTMYLELQEAVRLYPISLGTELPNLMVVERYNKAGEPTHRDIFRGLYDLVLARRTDKGLDVMIGDFKTGQTPALQHMLKDVQVLLYDFFSRTMWQTLSASYSVLGAFEPVVRRSLGFIYPRGMQGVTIGEFDRLPFESLLTNMMNGMRKRRGVKTPETIAKEAAKAEKAARAAARAAAKAAKEAAAAPAKRSKKK
ncbi:MAG: PD-(D/E)XK nuclease family protein [Elusimicrobia bacterium]|nr:PD-(D/E)XK nuclease family protein [Elusimicrobiota bacterium]